MKTIKIQSENGYGLSNFSINKRFDNETISTKINYPTEGKIVSIEQKTFVDDKALVDIIINLSKD